MDNINWNEVQEEFDRPVPGGYIAKILHVKDNPEKKCLYIQWDFAEGNFKGNNQDTFDRLGFWPILLVRSYKPTALSFFKGFKTAVEDSNRGYQFRNDPQSLEGKLIGVVLGEEQYISKNGDLKTRLYVAATRSIQAIQRGDFTVPAMKPLKAVGNTFSEPSFSTPQNQFAALEDDGEFPF